MSDFNYHRSPELMSASDVALLVVDVQKKLIGLLPDHKTIVWNIRRLLDGAAALEVQVRATEQYPQGLGGTVDELASLLGEIPAKQTFSCVGCHDLVNDLKQCDITKLLVVGIETHVCIQQTVLDLLAAGFAVYVTADASGSRHPLDHEVALRRMEACGAIVTTTESALFEWCQISG
ncbi:MAG: isochorismatase family protein, partial [Planctomycetales bacterium]